MNQPLLTLKGVHTHIAAYHILHGVDLASGNVLLRSAAR